MANASGSYLTTKDAIWKAWDKLPKPIRERLAEANDNWVPQPVLTYFRRAEARMWTGDAIAYVLRMIDRWDAEEREAHQWRMERMAAKGTDYHVPVRMKRKRKNG